MSDPTLLPPPPTSRDRAFSVTTNSQSLFTPTPASTSRLPPPSDSARRLSIASASPLSIEEFAIPDPFHPTPASPPPIASSGSFGAGSAFPVSHIGGIGGSGMNQSLNSAGRQVIWPRRSRDNSPAGSRSGSRPPSRPGSRPGSRRNSLLAQHRDSSVSRKPNWVLSVCNPALFLEIPNSDPLQTLLNKHLAPHARPTRDTSGNYEGKTIEEMVQSGSWRSLAVYARDSIVKMDGAELGDVLELWLIRLHSLHHLLLPSQATSELQSLFSTLHQLTSSRAIPPPTLASAMPFELEVMFARSKAYLPAPGKGGGEKDLLGAVEELGGLLGRCKRNARKVRRVEEGASGEEVKANPAELESTAAEERALWKDRAIRVGIIMSSILLDLKEPSTALSLLTPILTPSSPASLYLALIFVHLSLGDLSSSRVILEQLLSHEEIEDSVKVLAKGIVAAGYGNWAMMVDVLTPALKGRKDGAGDKVLVNALAVALLNKGDLEEAASLLEGEVKSGGREVLTEPMLFNMTTLYELQSGNSTQRKIDLLLRTVESVGDGLRPGCLKLS